MVLTSKTNRYIELVNTLPELLINCLSKIPAPDEIERLRAATHAYKTCYVELGSGSGGHLLERASTDPNNLYIGFELRYKRAYRTAEKAQQKNIHNIRVIRADASFLDRFFAPESIAGIFMNFPDPWERKKWKKHRMINKESLATFHRLLHSGGFFRYKTDHEGYFRDSVQLIDESNLFITIRQTNNLHQSEYLHDNVSTEFERLFISKGLPTYFVEIQRRS